MIVQTDGTILLDVHHEKYEQARTHLARFAELEKSPDHFHTYRVTALSLWNAASAGITTKEIIEQLSLISRYDIPNTILRFIEDMIGPINENTSSSRPSSRINVAVRPKRRRA